MVREFFLDFLVYLIQNQPRPLRRNFINRRIEVGGVAMVTALEIYSQPRDLSFSIGECKNPGEWYGKYAIVISRGPGHNFKLLLSCEPVFGSRETAIMAVEEALAAVCAAAKKEFESGESLVGQIFNPSSEPVPEDKVLNDERIARIIRELREKGTSETYDWK